MFPHEVDMSWPGAPIPFCESIRCPVLHSRSTNGKYLARDIGAAAILELKGEKRCAPRLAVAPLAVPASVSKACLVLSNDDNVDFRRSSQTV
jgi:hypothetical protein